MTLGLPRRARPDGSLLRDGAVVAMRRPPSWPSVALCLLGSVAACSPASDMQSDSGQPSPVMAQVSESGERAGPALPYIVDDVCPAEGCAFGTWEACGPVPGYAEAGDRGTEVFRLSLEESFTVHNGRMRVTEPGPVVIQKSTTVPQGDSTVVFAVGGYRLRPALCGGGALQCVVSGGGGGDQGFLGVDSASGRVASRSD